MIVVPLCYSMITVQYLIATLENKPREPYRNKAKNLRKGLTVVLLLISNIFTTIRMPIMRNEHSYNKYIPQCRGVI